MADGEYYLFDNISAYQIRRTPLISTAQQDRCVWKLEKNSIYSVRSAYRSIMEKDVNSHQHGIDGNWKQIWRNKILPRD